MNQESLVAKRDEAVKKTEQMLEKVKEINGVLEQLKSAILVERGRIDAFQSMISGEEDGTGDSQPSE